MPRIIALYGYVVLAVSLVATLAEASVLASEGWLAIRSRERKRAIGEGWYRYGDSNPGPVAENLAPTAITRDRGLCFLIAI